MDLSNIYGSEGTQWGDHGAQVPTQIECSEDEGKRAPQSHPAATGYLHTIWKTGR
jgi:hypothetical protein